MCSDEGNRREALAAGALAVVAMYGATCFAVLAIKLLVINTFAMYANSATPDANLHSECAALLCCLCGALPSAPPLTSNILRLRV